MIDKHRRKDDKGYVMHPFGKVFRWELFQLQKSYLAAIEREQNQQKKGISNRKLREARKTLVTLLCDYPDVLELKECCQIIGFGETFTRKLIKNQEFPSIRHSTRGYLFSKTLLIDYLLSEKYSDTAKQVHGRKKSKQTE